MKIFSKNTWGVDVNNAWPLTCKASCLKKIELRPLISGFDFALLEVRNLCVASRLVLTGVTSFEVYVSDVIGRRFEKVKNDHIFENWTSMRDWTFDLSFTYIIIMIYYLVLENNFIVDSNMTSFFRFVDK
jgi:hypothetical protein